MVSMGRDSQQHRAEPCRELAGSLHSTLRTTPLGRGPGVSHGIEFRLLGTVEVVAGDRVLELGSPKQRTLLAALLLRVNTVVPADVLMDDLWGESPPPSAPATLQSLVYSLRRTVAIRSKDGGYVLEADADRVDTVRFDRLVADGRQALTAGDGALAAERLEAAVALLPGAAM